MTTYDFRAIEKKWQQYWEKNKTYQTSIQKDQPKFYALDMFPYPSGAGLHVGHPLGYIASDIISRYKRLKGYNVLHPMGFDSFGLPAEQYAIQTGQHPAKTTEENIARYEEQLKNIGFSYDWDRSLRTSDPKFYKWTQWIFIQLFHSWYNKMSDKAEAISLLIEIFEKEGNVKVEAYGGESVPLFTAEDWLSFTTDEQQKILLSYRLAYLDEMTVNWCPVLGTVLANDEVKDGVSERGGHPVIRKKMQQWALRITAYAERLLNDLDQLDWTDSLKEMQKNWIGKSYGMETQFVVRSNQNQPIDITVFTTRIDTIYGVTFLALAPESTLIEQITIEEQKEEVKNYIEKAKNRSERDRQSEVLSASGVFTGSYAVHPITSDKIPVWVADYVLAGYGTGAVMGVPSNDERDYRFAQKYNLPVPTILEGEGTTIEMEDFDPSAGTFVNSGILNGLSCEEAIIKMMDYMVEKGLGKKKVNFRLRDAIFARQRYWGEPIPVYYKGALPYTLETNKLPLTLPEVDQYLPTEDGDPPLARAQNWITAEGDPIEYNTMPGWAGSSWYWLRYMDPDNEENLVQKQALNYWQNVDLYIGGTEHAVGHLLYSRFWTKFLYDLNVIPVSEPFKKLINQGMIQGRSNLVYRLKNENTFVSKGLKDQYDTLTLHVDVSLVENDQLNIEAFKQWRPDLKEARFVLEDGEYYCGYEVEKMSKRLYNVVNPDDVIDQYGADTLRLYEMFLGPLEQSKPWNTNGIDGVHKFLKKLWRLFYNDEGQWLVEKGQASPEALKIIHKTIQKVEGDMERYVFNTSVSAFMVSVNELQSIQCHNQHILECLLLILSPYAPHICEELWKALGHEESITLNKFPVFNPEFIKENDFEYPISINGKMRLKLSFPISASKEAMEKEILDHETIRKWIDDKTVKKIIIVPQKIVNIVV